MEISRVSRILIVIFLALSVLFYSLYRKEALSKMYLSDDFVSGAVLNLKNSGVTVSEEIIDRTIPEKDIYVFDVKDVIKHHDAVSDALISVLYSGSAVKASFDTPDGVSVGIYEKQNESKEIGRILFSNSDLSFTFSKEGAGINGENTPITNGNTDSLTANHKITIGSIVEKMSTDSGRSYRICGSSSNDEYVIVTVVQQAGGHDVNDVFINIVFLENEVVSVSGKWVVEDIRAKYHNTLVDGVNVLYKLDFENVKSIENERLVYSLRKSNNNRYFLIPCWEITYTDSAGSLCTSYFDAL